MERLLLSILLLTFLAACTLQKQNDNEPTRLFGESEASLKLSYRPSESIWHSVIREGRCPDGVSEIHRKIIQRSANFSKNVTTNAITSGFVIERWEAHGCSKTYPYEVKFSSDGISEADQ